MSRDLVLLYVETTPPVDDLKLFGVIVRYYDAEPLFQRSFRRWWKSAGRIILFDDGRVKVQMQSHLTDVQQRVVAGVVEAAYRGGVKYARAHEYKRVRQSKRVKVAYYWGGIWVGVRPDDDPLLDELHAILHHSEPYEREQQVSSVDERLHQDQ